MESKKELLKKYTAMEIALTKAAKFCSNGMNVFVGVGLSLLPAQLAKALHAPEIVIIYEGGSIGATPKGRVPWGVDDTVVQTDAECQTDLITTLGCLVTSGRVELCYLGAAQCDMYGNLNTTMRGTDHENPQVRISGSGGAHDLAVGVKNLVVIMEHRSDRIVEKLDYRTSPGFCEGGRSRWKKWALPGDGPAAIITNLAVLKPNLESYEMEIAEVHPFSTIDEVKENSGYDIKVAKEVKATEVPGEAEIKTIREQLDIGGEFTGWKKLFQ